MKFFKNRSERLIAFIALIVIGLPIAHATVTYLQRFTVAGTEKWRIENDGSVVSAGSMTFIGPNKIGSSQTGTATTLPTTTTGSNFARWIPVYNVGAAVTQGDVLIASNTGTGYVMKGTASSGLTTVVGIAAESIASGVNGWMVSLGGGYAVVHTTGTVAIGDVLVTTTSAAGYLATNNTPTSGTDVAIAMSAGTAAGGTALAIMK